MENSYTKYLELVEQGKIDPNKPCKTSNDIILEMVNTIKELKEEVDGYKKHISYLHEYLK